MSGASFAVIPELLGTEADRLESAAHRIRDLHEHPGVLRGRALDCGNDELTLAVVGFASAWRDGLDRLGGEATRWALLLRTAQRTYLLTEHTISSTFPAKGSP